MDFFVNFHLILMTWYIRDVQKKQTFSKNISSDFDDYNVTIILVEFQVPPFSRSNNFILNQLILFPIAMLYLFQLNKQSIQCVNIGKEKTFEL